MRVLSEIQTDAGAEDRFLAAMAAMTIPALAGRPEPERLAMIPDDRKAFLARLEAMEAKPQVVRVCVVRFPETGQRKDLAAHVDPRVKRKRKFYRTWSET